jgi:glutamyl-tRNA synthetase
MTDNMPRPVRVRFAPSPTGYLHVGGARTALYNWLYARKNGGIFLLRIEDTDVQRSSQEMVDVILNSLKWLNLNWDEGPSFQSERLDVYREAAMKLVERNKAYRCFCTPEELDARRQDGMKEKGSWKYERRCLQLSASDIEKNLKEGKRFAVRFLVPPGRTAFVDLVHGEISLDHSTVDDFVLLRSDHHPTYHLSVVVDDINMGITQVIRGDDHISNTPKQLLLYAAFEAPAPEFAHLPLILGPDKKRLSKRHGSVAVEEYRNQGILPETLVNFLALLGWNPGDDREILTREELVNEFDLRKVNSSNAVFDSKKLQWMNGKYLSLISIDQLIPLLVPFLENKEWLKDPDFVRRAELLRTRAFTLADLAEMLKPFYRTDFTYDTSALEKFRKDSSSQKALEEFLPTLAALSVWNHQTLEGALRDYTQQRAIKSGIVIHPIRLALTGKTGGPGLFEIMEVMGKDGTLVRLSRFLEELH